MIRAEFQLVDHHGRSVNAADFRGRFMLVYFGFTHCRVVCPRALARWSAVLDRLDARASRLVPLYITVDPDRDTPAVMKVYLETRHPRFTGLTGDAAQIDAAKRAFRVFAERKPDDQDADGYSVPHTAIAYLITPDGQYSAHFVDTLDEATLVHKMKTLVDGAA